LLVINVVAGLLFSPITAANHVNVVGAKPSDVKRIENELQWLKGRPCLRVNGESVEEQIMRRPDVHTAELSQNVFGRGELKVTYYEPVALVNGAKNVVLTKTGFLCAMPDPPAGLPALQLFDGGASPAFGVTTNWEPQKVADVCERAIKQGLVKNLSIGVTVSGQVCLNSGVTGRVVLGAPDELDEKFEKIRAILTAKPDLLDKGVQLVLTSPSKPVTSPLQGNFQ
jgi:hypothetical protein